MLVTTETIWEEFSNGLKHFILKRIPDESSAEDVLQDVFLKIHARIDRLRDVEKLPAWVYQVARNAIYDYYRQHRISQYSTDELPEEPYLPEDPFDDLVTELAPCIRAMVQSLPTDSRQALLLTDYEGMTQKELAAQLGLSLSGAKSRVQRGRDKIKQMLLDCCHFEFDRTGRIIDYHPRCAGCTRQESCSRCNAS